MTVLNKFRGALLGLACGDAVGTSVEFRKRGTFSPIKDMHGGGPFNLPKGYWTDDTSMALCLATSLIECRGFDAKDQMQRYLRWRDTGYLSSTGRCFDVGNATSLALSDFKQTGNPFSENPDPKKAGNGCLMRLAPVPLFFYPNRELTIEMSGESSRTTHAALECIEASQLFGAMLFMALDGANKEQILQNHGLDNVSSEKLQLVADGTYFNKVEDQIKGSGYVVESLEAALWCFQQTDTFEAAILKATNLGDDADTTAAICGQVAGAYYGESAIPQHWLNQLHMKNQIGELAEKLCNAK
ncbi:MAG: ADP-ribosylglycohydrolase family protein [Methylotenera sp.]|nr:ADP-ribosylglycohydrolase family protein [Methylotenera sp.]